MNQDSFDENFITYFFHVMREIRNKLSLPDFNPSTASLKNAIGMAADCLIPITACVIETIIACPIEGTTGKTTAYRSFLWPFINNSDSFFSDYYMERLFPQEELSDVSDDQSLLMLNDMAKQLRSSKNSLMTANASQNAREWCWPVL